MALCRSSGIASKMYVMPQLGVRISWRERYKPGPWHHPSASLKLKCNSPKSGYNKGTIRSDIRYLVVSKDVRRHRLISTDSVTAEVASSSLVVPAIHSKRVVPSSTKPTGVQKDTFLHPFCTPFRQLESFSLRGCRTYWPRLR